MKVLVPAFQKAARLPEYQEELKKAGYILNVMSPEQANQAFVERNETLKQLLRDLGKPKYE